MVIKITRIDERGNVYFDTESFKTKCFVLGDSLLLCNDERTFHEIPFHSGLYCKMFEPVLVEKDDTIFLAIRHGNAAKKYGLRVGQQVKLLLNVKGGFWEKENAYSFEEIIDRELYKNEEDYANFRPLFLGKKNLYRSSSPFDNAYGRAESVLSCIEEYKIKTIIDMADSEAELNNLVCVANAKTQEVVKRQTIFAIGDDTGLFSREFEQSVLLAMRALIVAETPCLIHCRAGKRRSGFICAILQALYGMSAEQIMDDYMVSYKNNNGITYGDNPKRYEYLKVDTIYKILTHINGPELEYLGQSTKEYLNKIGLSAKEIASLELIVHQ